MTEEDNPTNFEPPEEFDQPPDYSAEEEVKADYEAEQDANDEAEYRASLDAEAEQMAQQDAEDAEVQLKTDKKTREEWFKELMDTGLLFDIPVSRFKELYDLFRERGYDIRSNDSFRQIKIDFFNKVN
jgi:hypothetical protein